MKSGACDPRTARVGYCECLRACLMLWKYSECFLNAVTLKEGFYFKNIYIYIYHILENRPT